MKIEIVLKDPDGVYDCIRDDVQDSVATLGLPAAEAKALSEVRSSIVSGALSKWIEHGEYVTVIFDTEAMTATVKEVK